MIVQIDPGRLAEIEEAESASKSLKDPDATTLVSFTSAGVGSAVIVWLFSIIMFASTPYIFEARH